MKLHDIGPTPGSHKRRKRVGRGDSSGWGKTAGRGEKGQLSRTGAVHRPFFEGGQIPLFRRLPKRGFKNADRIVYQLINLSILEANFEAGAVVDCDEALETRFPQRIDEIVPFGCPTEVLHHHLVALAVSPRAVILHLE